jgi:hypothetical protein
MYCKQNTICKKYIKALKKYIKVLKILSSFKKRNLQHNLAKCSEEIRLFYRRQFGGNKSC